MKRGTWTPEEDAKLSAYVKTYGHSNWRLVALNLELSKSGQSCRLRWMNYLRPDIKRGGFTGQEDETIVRMHKELGPKWSRIAAELPGRTDNEVKNHWHTHLKTRDNLNKKRKEAKLKNVMARADDLAAPCILESSSSTMPPMSSSASGPEDVVIIGANLEREIPSHNTEDKFDGRIPPSILEDMNTFLDQLEATIYSGVEDVVIGSRSYPHGATSDTQVSQAESNGCSIPQNSGTTSASGPEDVVIGASIKRDISSDNTVDEIDWILSIPPSQLEDMRTSVDQLIEASMHCGVEDVVIVSTEVSSYPVPGLDVKSLIYEQSVEEDPFVSAISRLQDRQATSICKCAVLEEIADLYLPSTSSPPEDFDKEVMHFPNSKGEISSDNTVRGSDGSFWIHPPSLHEDMNTLLNKSVATMYSGLEDLVIGATEVSSYPVPGLDVKALIDEPFAEEDQIVSVTSSHDDLDTRFDFMMRCEAYVRVPHMLNRREKECLGPSQPVPPGDVNGQTAKPQIRIVSRFGEGGLISKVLHYILKCFGHS